jgi:hypothetical protein
MFEDQSSNSTVRIEFSLNECLTKPDAINLIETLFKNLDLNASRDLISLSMAIEKFEQSVHKLVLHFKNLFHGELFFNEISTNEKFSNFIKNIVDLKSEEIAYNEYSNVTLANKQELPDWSMISTSTDNESSIYVLNDDSSYFIENNFLQSKFCFFNLLEKLLNLFYYN